MDIDLSASVYRSFESLVNIFLLDCVALISLSCMCVTYSSYTYTHTHTEKVTLTLDSLFFVLGVILTSPQRRTCNRTTYVLVYLVPMEENKNEIINKIFSSFFTF